MSDRVPLGTQVVLHGEAADISGPVPGRGVAGRIVRDDGTGYTVSLADGRLVDVQGTELTSPGRAPAPRAPAATAASSDLVTERAIYAAAVGYRQVGSDCDIRGVYQAPTRAFWTLHKPPKHIAGPGSSWFSWEVERFCELALKANPICLELLWSPLAVWVDEAGRELLDLRGAFLSQSISRGYAAYVLSQFKKLEENDRRQGDQRWTQAAHLLRLMMDGMALLRTGDVAGSVGEHGDRLSAVRSAAVAWDQVESWRLELQQKLDEASATTFLPADPDSARVDAWLSGLRRRDVAVEAE